MVPRKIKKKPFRTCVFFRNVLVVSTNPQRIELRIRQLYNTTGLMTIDVSVIIVSEMLYTNRWHDIYTRIFYHFWSSAPFLRVVRGKDFFFLFQNRSINEMNFSERRSFYLAYVKSSHSTYWKMCQRHFKRFIWFYIMEFPSVQLACASVLFFFSDGFFKGNWKGRIS